MWRWRGEYEVKLKITPMVKKWQFLWSQAHSQHLKGSIHSIKKVVNLQLGGEFVIPKC